MFYSFQNRHGGYRVVRHPLTAIFSQKEPFHPAPFSCFPHFPAALSLSTHLQPPRHNKSLIHTPGKFVICIDFSAKKQYHSICTVFASVLTFPPLAKELAESQNIIRRVLKYTRDSGGQYPAPVKHKARRSRRFLSVF